MGRGGGLGFLGIGGVGVHTREGFSFSSKWPVLSSPCQLYLATLNYTKQTVQHRTDHWYHCMCLRTTLGLFWHCQGELSSWREDAPHTILILWGHRWPYPAPSYTAIVNILLDGREVPLTALTVTVHGDLYRRHQWQRYSQRSPAPWPIHSCWDSRMTGCPEVEGGYTRQQVSLWSHCV